MKNAFLPLAAATVLFAAPLAAQSPRSGETPALETGDVIAIAGDSITYHAAALDCGYYHRLTNVFARVVPEKRLAVAPLGFNGFQVSTWRHVVRQIATQDVWTHWRPGWNVGQVLTNKVGAIAIFLGMNDILQPSVRDDAAALDKWEADLAALVDELRAKTKARKCVLCTTTPLTADPFSPKNRVRLALGERLRKVAAAKRCGVADFGAGVMRAIEDARRFDPRVQPVPDFVHPRALGHWAMARELCAAFGETKCAAALEAGYQAELAAWTAKAPKRVSWRLFPLEKDSGAAFGTWRIDWWWNDAQGAAPAQPGALLSCAVALPDATWRVVSNTANDKGGSLVVQGVPARLVNDVALACTCADAAGARRQTVVVPVAASWRVSAPWDCPEAWSGQNWRTNAPAKQAEAAAALRGPWTRVTPTCDYTGFDAPGACDPYQAFFGGNLDSFWASRTVVSEKPRTVKAILSHQTFSATLGLTLFVNGQRICAVALDRHGGNRAETPPFALRQGANEIRLRVDHANWQREFACDLAPTAKGDDLSALRFDVAPPAGF